MASSSSVVSIPKAYVYKCLEGACIEYRWDLADQNIVDLPLLLFAMRSTVHTIVEEYSRAFHGNVKWYVFVVVEMVKLKIQDGWEFVDSDNAVFHSKARLLLNAIDNEVEFNELYSLSSEKINDSFSQYLKNGSGWKMLQVLEFGLFVSAYNPLCGSNGTFIDLPSGLKNKKAVINIKNDDDKCFLYSVLAYFVDDADGPCRVSRCKKEEQRLNMTGIEYPVAVKSGIDRFERQNPDIGINVYGYDIKGKGFRAQDVYVKRVTKYRTRKHIIKLLLVTDPDKNISHYTLINTKPLKRKTNAISKRKQKTVYNGMSRLLSGLTKYDHECTYCPFCLHRFTWKNQQINLEQHLSDCKEHRCQRTVLPRRLNEKFNSYKVQREDRLNVSDRGIPYQVYANFESYMPSPAHKPLGYWYFVLDGNGAVYKENTYYGGDAIEQFLDEMLTIALDVPLTLTILPMGAFCESIAKKLLASRDQRNHITFTAKRTREDQLTFTNYSATLRVPFTVYADFESFVVPNENDDSGASKTKKTSTHRPSGYCYVVIDEHGCKYKESIYRAVSQNDDVAGRFLEELLALKRELQPVLLENKKPTSDWTENLDKQKKCVICNDDFKFTTTPISDGHLSRCIYCHVQLINGHTADDGHVKLQPTQRFCDVCITNDYVLISFFSRKHHSHTSGEWLGRAHVDCNLNCKRTTTIPVVFHNFRGYDSHHVVQALARFKDRQVEYKCIATNSEKITSLEIWEPNCNEEKANKTPIVRIRFIDSFQFMQFSLKRLVDSDQQLESWLPRLNSSKSWLSSCEDSLRTTDMQMVERIEELKARIKSATQSVNENQREVNNRLRQIFPITTSCFPDQTSNWELLITKGVYPYSYVRDVNVFNETQLPSKEAFFNDLTKSEISNAEYKRAGVVWNAFQIKNMGEYHDFYMRQDVLLLCDIFETFRKIMFANTGLDPCHFLSSPHLSWNALLKITKVKLDLITDPSMYLFYEKGIRGGVSMIPKRYALANNPKDKKTYDNEKPIKTIKYYDARNLYGKCMTYRLPEGDFEWVKDVDDIAEKMRSTDRDVHFPDDSDTGYTFEVDLKYPVELHDLHRDFPLAPESMEVGDDVVSPFLHDENRIVCKKLLSTLYDKKEYVLDYRVLKFYLKHGLVLDKIHRGVRYRQSAWMSSYINNFYDKWHATKNKSERMTYKLLINSVYGKTIENVRKRIDFKLVTDQSRFLKLNASPLVERYYKINDDVVGLMMLKKTIRLNRPIYVGQAVCDISKMIMFCYHYEHFIQMYGRENIELLMTDTDSLLYEIEGPEKKIPWFGSVTNINPSDRRNRRQRLVKVSDIGQLKDEMKGTAIYEYVGLRAKMYSILETNQREKYRAKGVKSGSRVIDGDGSAMKSLNHLMFKECLFQNKVSLIRSTSIRSWNHRIYTIDQSKKALSPYDDKRFVLENKIDTLPYGHYLIPRIMAENKSSVDGGSNTFKRAGDEDEQLMPNTKKHKTS